MLPIAKIFTVTRNETDLIESFLLYHGKIFGYTNIVVIDNMSTCPIVKEVYKRFVPQGVTVVYEPGCSYSFQGDVFTKYMLKHKTEAKFLIGLDTSEFFFLRGLSSTRVDIEKYLNVIPTHISKLVIRARFSAILDTTSRHYIDQMIQNPVVNINTFRQEKIDPTKCIFRSDCFISATNGCHDGKTSRGQSLPCNRTVYFTYGKTGARRSIERAKDTIHERGFADTNAPLSDQLKSLVGVKSLNESDKLEEYKMFLSKLLCLEVITGKGKFPTHHNLSILASTFPTLLGKDIDVTSMQNLPSDWELEYENLVFHDKVDGGQFAHTGIVNTIIDQLQPLDPVLVCKPIKKIALMLSGHLRNFEPRKQFWIDFNKEFGDRVDIYIHTWNESGLRSKDEWIDIGSPPPDFDEIRKVMQPKKMLIEDHSEKSKGFSFLQPGLDLYYTNLRYLDRASDFTKNIGSQLYSVMKSWELARDSNVEYDMMIRLRNDCIIENFGNIFKRDTSFLAKEDVLVINGNSHRHALGGGGCSKCGTEYPERKHTDHVCDVCDIMYFGNPKVMERICNMFSHVKELVMSFKEYNKLALKDKEVRECLVKYPYAYGVKSHVVFETKIKCFYPERLIREYMKDYWLLTDMMGLIAKIEYQ